MKEQQNKTKLKIESDRRHAVERSSIYDDSGVFSKGEGRIDVAGSTSVSVTYLP